MRKLCWVSVVCVTFMTAELIGGYISNSLAIMTDAAHLLSDLLGFVISLCALFIGQRAPTNKHTYGYVRAEIIGALTSVILIWGLTLWLIYEAILRAINKPPGTLIPSLKLIFL
jgi:zinc transporter 2